MWNWEFFFFSFFLFKKTNGKILKQKQKLLFRFAIPAPKFVFWVLKLLIDASLVFQRGGGQAIRIEAMHDCEMTRLPFRIRSCWHQLALCFLIFPFSKKKIIINDGCFCLTRGSTYTVETI